MHSLDIFDDIWDMEESKEEIPFYPVPSFEDSLEDNPNSKYSFRINLKTGEIRTILKEN